MRTRGRTASLVCLSMLFSKSYEFLSMPVPGTFESLDEIYATNCSVGKDPAKMFKAGSFIGNFLIIVHCQTAFEKSRAFHW